MSLRLASVVIEAYGTCGENLEEIYNQKTLEVPDGYTAVDFRSPKKGEVYIGSDGSVASAIKDFNFRPLVIIQALPKDDNEKEKAYDFANDQEIEEWASERG